MTELDFFKNIHVSWSNGQKKQALEQFIYFLQNYNVEFEEACNRLTDIMDGRELIEFLLNYALICRSY